MKFSQHMAPPDMRTRPRQEIFCHVLCTWMVFFHLGAERVHLPSSTPQHFSRPSCPRLPSPLVLFVIHSAPSFSSFSASFFFLNIFYFFVCQAQSQHKDMGKDILSILRALWLPEMGNKTKPEKKSLLWAA